MKSQYSSGNKYDAAGAYMPINPNLKDLSKRSFILLGMLLGVKKEISMLAINKEISISCIQFIKYS